MTYLIIDTSTDICLIALVKDGRVLNERVFPHLNLLSKNLLLSIQGLMEKSETPLSSLSFIAAGIGPGSYTGTRLGAAASKSLAFGLNIRVKPFCSPLAFLPAQEGSFLFLIPTRAGPCFVLKGEQDGLQVHQQSADLFSDEELNAEASSVDYIICSLEQTLPENLKQKKRFLPSPNLPTLIKFLSNAGALPPEEIKLQYLHTPF